MRRFSGIQALLCAAALVGAACSAAESPDRDATASTASTATSLSVEVAPPTDPAPPTAAQTALMDLGVNVRHGPEMEWDKLEDFHWCGSADIEQRNSLSPTASTPALDEAEIVFRCLIDGIAGGWSSAAVVHGLTLDGNLAVEIWFTTNSGVGVFRSVNTEAASNSSWSTKRCDEFVQYGKPWLLTPSSCTSTPLVGTFEMAWRAIVDPSEPILARQVLPLCAVLADSIPSDDCSHEEGGNTFEVIVLEPGEPDVEALWARRSAQGDEVLRAHRETTADGYPTAPTVSRVGCDDSPQDTGCGLLLSLALRSDISQPQVGELAETVITGEPGDIVRLEGLVIPNPERERQHLWLVGEGAPGGPLLASLGVLVSTGGGFGDLIGELPGWVVDMRTTEYGRAHPEPIAAGTYGISSSSSGPIEGWTVEILESGSLPSAPPPDLGDGPAWLGTQSLADVPFGTTDVDAIARLTELFGAPTSDSGWGDFCIWSRTVAFDGLVATFHGDHPAESGTFARYEYFGDVLQTEQGVRLGLTPSDLLALDPDSSFGGTYDSRFATLWWPSTSDESGPLAASLSDDATVAGSAVTAIAVSGTEDSPYTVC